MPSETFYRLPEAKKRRIMEAVKKELSLHTISEVSINKIIQSAEISRGSFYQYFTDKYDMLAYVLCQFRNILGNRMRNILDEQSGDLFKSLNIFLTSGLELVREQRNNSLYHNLFSDMETHKILCKQEKKNGNAYFIIDILREKADLSVLNITDDEDLLIIVEMILDTCARGIMELLMNHEGEAMDMKIISHFQTKLKIIEKGFQNK